jgi:predicted  nucleic acid-binding Zn-ribbon protein
MKMGKGGIMIKWFKRLMAVIRLEYQMAKYGDYDPDKKALNEEIKNLDDRMDDAYKQYGMVRDPDRIKRLARKIRWHEKQT